MPVFWLNSLFSPNLFKKPFQYPHQSTSAQTTSWSTVSMWNKLQRSTKWKPFKFLQGQATWWVILPYTALNQSTVQSSSGVFRTVKETQICVLFQICLWFFCTHINPYKSEEFENMKYFFLKEVRGELKTYIIFWNY